MSPRGRLITFEGGEGTGKSTQAALLAERLGAVLTREPGGTRVGEAIRSVLLDQPTGEIAARTELFLMVAARAQHVNEVIEPVLSSGRDVVCDRFSASTLAYQGYGRGLPLDDVRAACRIAEAGVHPDLTVLLDVPVDVGFARLSNRRDRIEREEVDFHERVRSGFLELAASSLPDWVIVDGTEDPGAVASRVVDAVSAHFVDLIPSRR